MIIIETIGAFLATIVIGFILIRVVHKLVVYPWLYNYLFKRSLRLIREHGRGADEEINGEAILWNLSGRLRVVLILPLFLLTIVVVSTIVLTRNDILPMPVSIAIAVGFAFAYFGFIWVYLQLEQDGKTYCGRVVDIEWSTKSFVLDIGDGHKIEFESPDCNITDSFLVCGKKYLVGSYMYGWHMAPCDYYEWNDQKFPS